MINFAKKLFGYFFIFALIFAAAFLNWWKPLYLWFGDTPLYRFIWLGIFFILLDMVLELVSKAAKQVGLLTDLMSFGKDIRKVSPSFRVAAKVSLPNKLRADFVVIGSSGVWLVSVQDDGGKITFTGDDLARNGEPLKGLLTKALEKSYTLASFIKEKLGRDFKVTPVVTFSSTKADLREVPKMVRGVFVVPRSEAVSLVENTDVQLIDQKSIEDIYKILKK